MQLDELWQWDKKKLPCVTKVITGNPGADELRVRVAELAGIRLEDILLSINSKKSVNNFSSKSSSLNVVEKEIRRGETMTMAINESKDALDDDMRKSLMFRSHLLDSAHNSIKEIDKSKESVSNANLFKRYAIITRSPPKRISMDIQRERSRPLEMALSNLVEFKRKSSKKLPNRSRKDLSKTPASIFDFNASPGKTALKLHKRVLKEYSGDLFSTGGNYMGSMIYLSRMSMDKEHGLHTRDLKLENSILEAESNADSDIKQTIDKEPPSIRSSISGEAKLDEMSSPSSPSSSSSISSSCGAIGITPMGQSISSGMLGKEEMMDLASKLKCLSALCKWARCEANCIRLSKEGAIQAIIQISTINHRRIERLSCIAFRLLSESKLLAEDMIRQGSVTRISELAMSLSSEISKLCLNEDQADESSDKMRKPERRNSNGLRSSINLAAGQVIEVKKAVKKSLQFNLANLAITLVNLTRVNGMEAKLVEDGIVVALLQVITEDSSVESFCSRALYNLTCIESSYPFIERVFKALVFLAPTADAELKRICASALCNLTDIQVSRSRMVEEGVIPVLSSLARGSDAKTRRICAVILQNLASSKVCRVEMVARGAVQACYALSNDSDILIMQCVSVTLMLLSEEISNCNRILNEGGVNAICSISSRFSSNAFICQACSVGLWNISTSDIAKVSMVDEGCMPALTSLLRCKNPYSSKFTLMALSNVLMMNDNHTPAIQHGCLPCLVDLASCGHAEILRLCAICLFSLSCNHDVHAILLSSSVTRSLSTLVNSGPDDICMTCAATLCNLSSHSKGIVIMIAEGAIELLVKLVGLNQVSISRYCYSAMCRLADTTEHCLLIASSCALNTMIQGTMGGDEVTREYCGAVLSSLSHREGCRKLLLKSGILDAIAELSKSSTESTRLRALITYANLSCDDEICERMIALNSTTTIARLADSYQERNQSCCACALCNISHHKSHSVNESNDEMVEALMMICMVRSVDKGTKRVCAKALSNLLSEQTLDSLLSSGIVPIMVKLASVEDAESKCVAIQCLSFVSRYHQGRQTIIDKTGSIHSVMQLANSDDSNVSMTALSTICNLLLFPQSRITAVSAGAISVLAIASGLKDTNDKEVTCKRQSALVEALLTSDDGTCVEFDNKPRVLAGIMSLLTSSDRFTLMYSLWALSNLSWRETSSNYLIEANAIKGILLFVPVHAGDEESLAICANVLCYLIALPLLKGLKDHTDDCDINEIHDCVRIIMESLCSATHPNIMSINCVLAVIHALSIHSSLLMARNCNLIFSILSHASTLFSSCEHQHILCYLENIILLNLSRHGIDIFSQIPRESLAECVENVVKCIIFLHGVGCDSVSLSKIILQVTSSDYSRDEAIRAGLTPVALDIADTNLVVPSSHLDSVTSLFNLSRSSSLKATFLACNPSQVLVKYSRLDDEESRNIASKTLGNLSTDQDKGVEEGTVAALISLSIARSSKAPSTPATNASHAAHFKNAVDFQVDLRLYGPPSTIRLSSRLNIQPIIEHRELFKISQVYESPEPPAPPKADVTIDVSCLSGSKLLSTVLPPDLLTLIKSLSGHDDTSRRSLISPHPIARSSESSNRMGFAKMEIQSLVLERFDVANSELEMADPDQDIPMNQLLDMVSEEFIHGGIVLGKLELKKKFNYSGELSQVDSLLAPIQSSKPTDRESRQGFDSRKEERQKSNQSSRRPKNSREQRTRAKVEFDDSLGSSVPPSRSSSPDIEKNEDMPELANGSITRQDSEKANAAAQHATRLKLYK